MVGFLFGSPLPSKKRARILRTAQASVDSSAWAVVANARDDDEVPQLCLGRGAGRPEDQVLQRHLCQAEQPTF